ncbi:OsmC family protein [Shouchella hunanensis]|uniref:OsmC family protein n=2 Tax=Bacillaceae TaxID=186817 RepID=A0ABY7WAW8_9BACI|nr:MULTISPECIES: OsmC family protein [Shouchella]WDF05841.1 OsmC family protein [Shouchella hunanensis]
MKDIGYTIDLPYGKLDISGDESAGFRPFQLLVSSIAVCSGGVFRTILDKKRISYKSINLEADVVRNEANVNEVTEVHLTFIIEGAQANFEKLEKALQLATKNCPIVQSVNKSINITETIKMI